MPISPRIHGLKSGILQQAARKVTPETTPLYRRKISGEKIRRAKIKTGGKKVFQGLEIAYALQRMGGWQ
jgi:hypothetical protein